MIDHIRCGGKVKLRSDGYRRCRCGYIEFEGEAMKQERRAKDQPAVDLSQPAPASTYKPRIKAIWVA